MAATCCVDMYIPTPAGNVAHFVILLLEPKDVDECGCEFRYDFTRDAINLGITTEGMDKFDSVIIFEKVAEMWDAMQIAKASGITNEDDLIRFARIEAGFSPEVPR